jgi:putative transposase
MRYSASDKTEIIRLVEQSHLPARRTLEKLGIPRSSFYRWYDGVDGAPNGIIVPRWSLSSTHLKGSRPWASLSGI